jgi:hypothetical protein
MKKPPVLETRAIVVVSIGDKGGVTEDGRAAVIEFELLNGERVSFEFPRNVADKLASVAERLAFEARKLAGPAASGETTSTAGALVIKPSMLSFQAKTDGSGAWMVVRRPGDPPLSIDLQPHDFQSLRDQLAHTERLMRQARKSKAH